MLKVLEWLAVHHHYADPAPAMTSLDKILPKGERSARSGTVAVGSVPGGKTPREEKSQGANLSRQGAVLDVARARTLCPPGLHRNPTRGKPQFGHGRPAVERSKPSNRVKSLA
jgi:hypothetical protein